MAQLNINGRSHQVDVEPDTRCLGNSRAGRIDRYQIWLRRGAMRRLFRAPER